LEEKRKDKEKKGGRADREAGKEDAENRNFLIAIFIFNT
jgi:hypothetical protein